MRAARLLLLAGLPLCASSAPATARTDGTSRNGLIVVLAGNPRIVRAWTLEPATGATRQLPFRGRLYGIAWAPDERRITLASPNGLFTWRLDGSRRFDHRWYSYDEPAWSPDGRRIALVDWPSGRSPDTTIEIVRVGARGRFVERGVVTIGDRFDESDEDVGEYFDPAWSPNGASIAFTARVNAADNAYNVYVAGANGRNVRRLTDDGSTSGSPEWSPDGRQLAFASNRDGRFRIYSMNADGTGATPLTAGGDDAEPTWSPDGTELAFVRQAAVGAQIRVLELATRRDRLVATLAGEAYSLDWQRR